MTRKFFTKGTYYTHYPTVENLSSYQRFAQEAAGIVAYNLSPESLAELSVLCRGSSGAIIGAFFTLELERLSHVKVSMSHVKKDNERSHHGFLPIIKKAIIIDDFLCSGDTVNAIYEKADNPEVLFLIALNAVGEYKLKNILNFIPHSVIGSINYKND